MDEKGPFEANNMLVRCAAIFDINKCFFPSKFKLFLLRQLHSQFYVQQTIGMLNVILKNFDGSFMGFYNQNLSCNFVPFKRNDRCSFESSWKAYNHKETAISLSTWKVCMWVDTLGQSSQFT